MGFVISYASSEYTFEMVQSHTWYKRKATQTGEMQEGGCYIIRQTSCIARQAMHKSGYASPKIQVNANNKHTSGTEMDFAYHKMHKIASNGIFSWKQGNVVGLQVLFCAHTLVTS